MRKRIADYGLIGDGETAALVSRDGAIEWLCLPRFDSDACFAALVGGEGDGRWLLAPDGEVTGSSRRYQGDTLILETLWTTPTGEAAVIDFMPMRGEAPDVVRIVEGRGGRVAMRSALALRFDYGRVSPLVERRSARELAAVAGPNAAVVRADVGLEHGGDAITSRFEVGEGERVAFAMTWHPSHEGEPAPLDPPRDLENTRAFWRNWIAQLRYDGPHRDAVARSLLTLKALAHAPTGGMVAAPTTSLPERPGGARNWDYRYCWLRDATWTVIAFVEAGFDAEAAAWIGWLRRALAGEPVDLQPLYTVTGRRRAPEQEADWLSGFDGARPVRIGNAAHGQFQLDAYGEVLDALLIARRRGVGGDCGRLVRLLAARLEELWDRPDAGVWEERGPPRHHVQSKLMCWVAFDRAAAWFEEDEKPALAARYRGLADQVRDQVLERGFDPGRGAFTRAYGDPALDAAALLVPLVGFLPADDPRVAGTVAAIERELVRDGQVRRYLPEQAGDGVGGGEGAFTPCGFWLAAVRAMQGRAEEARATFARLCGAANDLGLLSEEVGAGGELLGNFPQALSHLSLVCTALTFGGGRAPRRLGADGGGAP